MRVTRITQVQWLGLYSALVTNTNPGGGLAIFPDWRWPDFWQPSPADKGAWVWVNAVLSPPPIDPAQPLNVWFCAYDVDDPSASAAPVDDESLTADNRGKDAQGYSGFFNAYPLDPSFTKFKVRETAATNGNCGTIFRVSLNPGDNWRVLADFEDHYAWWRARQNDGTQARIVAVWDENQSPPQEYYTQSILTVWRRLNVERDSMAAVTGNTVTGTVAGISYPQAGQTDVDLGRLLPETHNDLNQFVGGTLTITGFGPYNVKSSTANWFGTDHIVVNATIPTGAIGCQYTLVDDDSVVLPKLADQALMEAKYKPAYVLPVALTGSFLGNLIVDQDAGFQLNFDHESASAVDGLCNPKRDLPCSIWFWCGQVMSGFQPRTTHDTDGYGENVLVLGITRYQWPWGSYNYCVIFLEVLKDVYILPGPNLLEQATVVHETGHMFQCIHTDLGIMQASGFKETDVFTPVSLDRIRDAQKPGAN